jgi:hypothetical protein
MQYRAGLHELDVGARTAWRYEREVFVLAINYLKRSKGHRYVDQRQNTGHHPAHNGTL